MVYHWYTETPHNFPAKQGWGNTEVLGLQSGDIRRQLPSPLPIWLQRAGLTSWISPDWAGYAVSQTRNNVRAVSDYPGETPWCFVPRGGWSIKSGMRSCYNPTCNTRYRQEQCALVFRVSFCGNTDPDLRYLEDYHRFTVLIFSGEGPFLWQILYFRPNIPCANVEGIHNVGEIRTLPVVRDRSETGPRGLVQGMLAVNEHLRYVCGRGFSQCSWDYPGIRFTQLKTTKFRKVTAKNILQKHWTGLTSVRREGVTRFVGEHQGSVFRTHLIISQNNTPPNPPINITIEHPPRHKFTRKHVLDWEGCPGKMEHEWHDINKEIWLSIDFRRSDNDIINHIFPIVSKSNCINHRHPQSARSWL